MARILVIEDHEDIREAVVEIFRLDGYEVSSAEHGLAGLAEARRHTPDVILLDLAMPVMDGFAFLAEQRRDARLASIPVVVMSAFSRPAHIDPAGYLTKPFSIDEVLEAVRRRLPVPVGARSS